MGAPLRPEPVRAVPKVGLEDRLQHHLRGSLDHPISYRRDPQRSLLPVCLRDQHPPHRVAADTVPPAARSPAPPGTPRPRAAQSSLDGLPDPRRPPQRWPSPPATPSPRCPRGTPCRTARGTAALDSPSRPDTVLVWSSSRSVAGVVSLVGIHQRLPPAEHTDQVRPLPSAVVLLSTPSSVLWAAPTPAPLSPTSPGAPLIGFVAPSPPPRDGTPRVSLLGRRRVSPVPTTAVPPFHVPLRRRVLRGCISKLFTPSMAFAHAPEARLPVGLLAEGIFSTRQASLHAADWWVAPLLKEGSTPRFDARISPNAGGLLQRWLGPSFDRTSTG